MRIVDLKTFMSLPPGTVYYRVKNGNLQGLSIKRESNDNCDPDFNKVGLGDARINEADTRFDQEEVFELAFKDGRELTLDLTDTRWVINASRDDRFAVLDFSDIHQLMTVLTDTRAHDRGDLISSAHLLDLPTRF